MSERTYAENVAEMEQRLKGKSDAEQWWEVHTTQIRESFIRLYEQNQVSDAAIAQARADERERIAKAVEIWAIDPMNMVSVSYGEVSHTDTANNYAAAIRNLDGDDNK